MSFRNIGFSLPKGADPCHPIISQNARHAWRTARAAPFLAVLTLCSGTAIAAGPAPVKLGSAKYFVILTETGVADVAASAVTGNVGTSPITGAADLLSCAEVTGHVLSVDAAGPQPCSHAKAASLTRSIGAMETAYTDAAGRTPDVNELGGGNIGGLTITPGTYKWTTDVLIGSNVTLMGGRKDVWIFQVAQDVKPCKRHGHSSCGRRECEKHLLAGCRSGHDGHDISLRGRRAVENHDCNENRSVNHRQAICANGRHLGNEHGHKTGPLTTCSFRLRKDVGEPLVSLGETCHASFIARHWVPCSP